LRFFFRESAPSSYDDSLGSALLLDSKSTEEEGFRRDDRGFLCFGAGLDDVDVRGGVSSQLEIEMTFGSSSGDSGLIDLGLRDISQKSSFD
jgi:hypothetical protein